MTLHPTTTQPTLPTPQIETPPNHNKYKLISRLGLCIIGTLLLAMTTSVFLASFFPSSIYIGIGLLSALILSIVSLSIFASYTMPRMATKKEPERSQIHQQELKDVLPKTLPPFTPPLSFLPSTLPPPEERTRTRQFILPPKAKTQKK